MGLVGGGNSSGIRQLVTDGAMTGTAVVTSIPFNIQDLGNIALQMVWTGTPNGTFVVQGSVDYNGVSGGDWVTLPLAAMSATGAAGSILADMDALGFPWVRAVYTNSSSTGTLQVYAFGKAV